MKIAVISDIHANLPALEAVFADIEKQNPDDIFCLGDLVNFAGWDNEVIELIKKKNITCIKGNHDDGISDKRNDFLFGYENEAQLSFTRLSIKKANETITEANRNFLGNLPFMLQLQFRFPFHNLHIAMVHGSAYDFNEYISENAEERYLLEMLDSANADILLMGHTHIPFHRAILCEEENKKIYRHIINAGSVGKPRAGDKSGYVLLEINKQTDLSDPTSVKVHFRQVVYDIEKVIGHIHNIGLTNAYDEFLRSGK
jgi:putative phosphoesterase